VEPVTQTCCSGWCGPPAVETAPAHRGSDVRSRRWRTSPGWLPRERSSEVRKCKSRHRISADRCLWRVHWLCEVGTRRRLPSRARRHLRAAGTPEASRRDSQPAVALLAEGGARLTHGKPLRCGQRAEGVAKACSRHVGKQWHGQRASGGGVPARASGVARLRGRLLPSVALGLCPARFPGGTARRDRPLWHRPTLRRHELRSDWRTIRRFAFGDRFPGGPSDRKPRQFGPESNLARTTVGRSRGPQSLYGS